jgi:hypothetical protein
LLAGRRLTHAAGADARRRRRATQARRDRARIQIQLASHVAPEHRTELDQIAGHDVDRVVAAQPRHLGAAAARDALARHRIRVRRR